MHPRIIWRPIYICVCVLVLVAACNEAVAPPPAAPTLIVNGTVTDSHGVAVPGTQVRLWLNYVLNWAYFAETFTDSLGRFSLRFDSLPTPLDSIVGTAYPPGCSALEEAVSVIPPTGSPTSESVLPIQIALTTALPRATGDTGRLNGGASDDGLFGYSGCLYMLIEQSVVYQPTGAIAFLGRWHLIWNPSYASESGTFRGEQTSTSVSLEFDEGGCHTAWEAPVSADGDWGTLRPTSPDCPGPWGMFPMTLARDTSSGVWP